MCPQGQSFTPELDLIVSRFQNMPSWNIYEVLPDGSIKPWFEVNGGIVRDLVIMEGNLREQVELIPAQIMYWGRLAAHAKRVWEICERRYRQWRDSQALKLVDSSGKGEGWKKPTLAQVDEIVHTLPEYPIFYNDMERAEEAHMATMAVTEGFRAKKELLKMAVIKYQDDSQPRLSI